MSRRPLQAILLVVTALALSSSAWSARPEDDAGTLPADNPYALGQKAIDAEDWNGVIKHMTEVVRAKPWHDNAYSLLAFAHRKLGDIDTSLSFYDKALALNPYNREALEYLGEAYLDLDQPERTEEVLEKLTLACQRIAASFPEGDWQTGCEEWVHLNAAYQAHITGQPRPEHD